MACEVGADADWAFRTTLTLRCGGQGRTVESFTTVALCGKGLYGTDPKRTWASSGDVCGSCAAIICEMAPSPLVPGSASDDLPLGAALDVVVRPLARVGGALVLLAEHAPKDLLTYDWQATAGTLDHLDQDVVLWRLPAATPTGAQLAQVAVSGTTLAAVASYRWDRQAA
jgi:hypothetical protein